MTFESRKLKRTNVAFTSCLSKVMNLSKYIFLKIAIIIYEKSLISNKKNFQIRTNYLSMGQYLLQKYIDTI